MNLRVNRAVDCHTKNAGKHSRMSLSMEEGLYCCIRNKDAAQNSRGDPRSAYERFIEFLPANVIEDLQRCWRYKGSSERQGSGEVTDGFPHDEVLYLSLSTRLNCLEIHHDLYALRHMASLRIDCRSHDISKFKHQHDSTKF